MAETRCDCCDLPTYSCGKALEAATRRPALDGPTVEAQYGGKCTRCGDWFAAGTRIMRAEDAWVCCP